MCLRLCVAGQYLLPDDYLHSAHATIKKYGGLFIADEVQTGFGTPPVPHYSRPLSLSFALFRPHVLLCAVDSVVRRRIHCHR